MFLSPLQVVQHVPIRSGMRIGDFGSGNGQHALLLSERLQGEGSIYAFDWNSESIESLARERARKNAQNLFSLCTDLNSHLPLKDRLLHCALLSNTLHALSQRKEFLQELHRVLVDDGSVVFVDWAHSFNNMGPRAEDVLYPPDAVKLFESNGFSVGGMIPAGTHHYAFIAKKSA